MSGKRREGKCLHVNTDGSVCGLSHGMRTEREYCYTCQRLVPYDKDTTSDARHYTQSLTHRVGSKHVYFNSVKMVEFYPRFYNFLFARI